VGFEDLRDILSSENPDIIVLTGDILDRSGSLQNPAFVEFSRSLAGIADTNHIKPELVFSGYAHGGQFRIPHDGFTGVFYKYSAGAPCGGCQSESFNRIG